MSEYNFFLVSIIYVRNNDINKMKLNLRNSRTNEKKIEKKAKI